MTRICSYTLVVSAIVLGLAAEAPTPVLGNPANNGAQEARHKPAESKGLRRASFQVTHASCLSCLRDIERTIRLTPGVKDVEVGIRSPYNSVVIYDTTETSLDTMFAPIRKRGYGFVKISEVPAQGKGAIIVRKAQKPSPAVEALLNGD
jgi:copper chaperone CopZ